MYYKVTIFSTDGRMERWTDGHMDACDFIFCPVQSYSWVLIVTLIFNRIVVNLMHHLQRKHISLCLNSLDVSDAWFRVRTTFIQSIQQAHIWDSCIGIWSDLFANYYLILGQSVQVMNLWNRNTKCQIFKMWTKLCFYSCCCDNLHWQWWYSSWSETLVKFCTWVYGYGLTRFLTVELVTIIPYVCYFYKRTDGAISWLNRIWHVNCWYYSSIKVVYFL